jgi:glycosyl transferase family 25
MKAFVVSLAKSRERRESIKRQLANTSLDWEFIEAVDGYAMSTADITLSTDPEALRKAPRYLNPGQIGCSLSHISCYSRILDEGLEHALVIEDDMLLDLSRLAEACKAAVLKLEERSVVLLYYRSHPGGKQCNFRYIDSSAVNLRLAAPISIQDIPLCTGAYIISRKACQSLQANLFPVAHGADQWDVFLRNRWIDTLYVITPPIATGSFFPSEIRYTDSYSGYLKKFFKKVMAITPFGRQLKRINRAKIEQEMQNFVFYES